MLQPNLNSLFCLMTKKKKVNIFLKLKKVFYVYFQPFRYGKLHKYKILQLFKREKKLCFYCHFSIHCLQIRGTHSNSENYNCKGFPAIHITSRVSGSLEEGRATLYKDVSLPTVTFFFQYFFVLSLISLMQCCVVEIVVVLTLSCP